MAVLYRVTLCSFIVACVLAACAGPVKQAFSPLEHLSRQQSSQTADIDWPTFGFNEARWSFNANETTLTNANVSGLTLKWSFATGATRIDTQPIIAANVPMASGARADIMYVGDENGNFYALNAATGSLIWSKKLRTASSPCWDGESNGIDTAATIDDKLDRVYVIDGGGILHTFRMASGKWVPRFPPLQVFTRPYVTHAWSGLLLDSTHSTLYFPTASHCDAGTYYGTINAVNTVTQAITTFNLVTNSQEYYGDGVWGWGGESIAPNGNVYAGVGNSKGLLKETGQYSDSVIELTHNLQFIADEQPESNLEDDLDIGTTPVLFFEQGSYCAAFERKNGDFFTVDRKALQNGVYATKTHLGGTLAAPAYSPVTHALYVSAPKGLTRLNIGPNCTISVAWQTAITADGLSVPAATPQLVFASSGTGTLYAIDAQTGSILWNSGSTIQARIAAEPTVVNGHVYVSAWDGHIYAFGL